MKFSATIIALAALAGSAFGHMEMTSPPALGSPLNPNGGGPSPDYDMKAPLGAGANAGTFPCRGHLNLLGTDAGKSVATWAAGSTQSLTIGGSAYHNGGSCQAMLSYDQGNSWTVIKSWIGNCPIASGGTFSFKVPADAPAGNPVFAWSWFNRSGNREMYHNCAAITITGSSGSESTPFSQRPAPFMANVAGQTTCATVEGGDVVFPNPGPDVENTSTNPNQPVGDCGSSSGNSGATVPTTIPGGNLIAEPSTTAAASETAPATDATAAPSATTPAAAASSSAGNRQCKRWRKRSYPARMH